MLHRLRWVLALATCGVWGCAAISGLDGLDVGADASTFDATKPDGSVLDAAADAPTSDVAPPKDSGTDSSSFDSGCGSGIPCAAEQQGGCCSASETCGPNGCCKGVGGSCGSSGGCCSQMVCTAGGTCQTSCTPLDAGCQSGSQDKCCRGQAYCLSLNGTGHCAACLANDAGCFSDQQCCSRNCDPSSVCKP